MKIENLNVKKRLMYNTENDYYFITYNIIIFLNSLGCIDEQHKFTDYTKLPYIIPFISSRKLVEILLTYNNLNRMPSKEEIDLLQDTYIKSRLRQKTIASILFSLEHQHIIYMKKNATRKSLDIWINKEKIPTHFLTSDLFKAERSNIDYFRRIVPRTTIITNQTLLNHLFKSKGVKVWEI